MSHDSSHARAVFARMPAKQRAQRARSWHVQNRVHGQVSVVNDSLGSVTLMNKLVRATPYCAARERRTGDWRQSIGYVDSTIPICQITEQLHDMFRTSVKPYKTQNGCARFGVVIPSWVVSESSCHVQRAEASESVHTTLSFAIRIHTKPETENRQATIQLNRSLLHTSFRLFLQNAVLFAKCESNW